MKKLYDVCVPRKNSKGEYIKNKDGKNIYDNYGFIAEDDKGFKKLCLKNITGDIWCNLYEIKDKP